MPSKSHTTTQWSNRLLTIIICCLGLLFLIATPSQSQPPQAKQPAVICKDKFYQTAFDEITAMLDGKAPLSIKRAVFLAEWAYLDGELNYDEYSNHIDSVVVFLNKFYLINGADKYKTGKNMVLQEYFFNPYSGNNYKPFAYDFNIKDHTAQFVTRVIKTHSGQCRSLPMYYKILAEAIGAEAYISFSKLHVLIRYPDHDNLYPEPWVNLELTSRQIQPEFWIKENAEISDKSIENKLYLYNLSDLETVAYQLSGLALGYREKYGVYDDFTLQCAKKSMEYFPQYANTIIILAKSYEAKLTAHLKRNGGWVDSYTNFYDNKLKELEEYLYSLGWEPISEELHKKFEEQNRQAKVIFETESNKR